MMVLHTEQGEIFHQGGQSVTNTSTITARTVRVHNESASFWTISFKKITKHSVMMLKIE